MGVKSRLRVLAVLIALVFLLSAVLALPATVGEHQVTLPPPEAIDMALEEAICRRMSVREFTEEPVSELELSTLLWYAYGGIDGQRSIHPVAATYGLHIYVLWEDGVYRYDPGNHSLELFRQGDHRWIGQYDTAAVKLAIVWDQQCCTSQEVAGANVGQVGQNVYFAANALGLGTVTTASEVAQLRFLGLPRHEAPIIIMLIGHPVHSYDFTYEPLASTLPIPVNASMSLSTAIEERSEAIAWQGGLTPREQAQLIWSSYGASYYVDEVNGMRHRTVPSSHGTYPLRILCCNATSVFEYLPEEHALATRIGEDRRSDVAAASRSFVSSAPLVLVPVLNTSMVDTRYPWPWHYEAAAAGYTALLEATAWNLSGNLIAAVDSDALRTALFLGEAYLPLYVVPLGRAASAADSQPPSVVIDQPESGYLYLFGRAVVPVQGTIVVGPMDVEASASDDYALQVLRFYVDGAAAGYSHDVAASMALPASVVPARHAVTVVAYDYAGHEARASLQYLKIM